MQQLVTKSYRLSVDPRSRLWLSVRSRMMSGGSTMKSSDTKVCLQHLRDPPTEELCAEVPEA